MESILPFILCFILPLFWTGLVFVLGRWSAQHKISVQRVDPQAPAQAAASPFYGKYQEEQ